MKKSTKHLSDVDLRGRIRRHPQIEQPTATVEAKFLDGPLAGTTQLVQKGQDYVKVGPWLYSFAGKDNRTPLYCKMPKSRRERGFLMFLISKRGSDPRVEMARMRGTPEKRTAPPVQGRGARRRLDKSNASALARGQAAWRASDEYNGT